MTGIERPWPRKVADGSTLDTSASTRGRKDEAIETEAIAAHGGLGFSAAGQVVPDIVRKIAPGRNYNFLVGDEV
jgi:hypothetical protein